MNQLDHLIVFLTSPNDVEALFPEAGELVLDPGTRHVGQGTRNRRVIFGNCYLELVWVDSPVEARASGLRFQDRCAGRACPFGVVYRGDVPAAAGPASGEFIDYAVPGGPKLKILDDPQAPFVGVYEIEHPTTSPPLRRKPREYLNDVEVTCAEIVADRVPPDIELPGVVFAVGEPQLTMTLTGARGSLRLTAGAHWTSGRIVSGG